MKKTVFVLAACACACCLFAEDAPPLTLEAALEAALAHSYTVRLKQAAVQKAAAQLRAAKAGTDVTVGADAGYRLHHTPYADDPYYGGQGISDVESSELSTSVWAQKAFSFGLQTRLSLGLSQSRSAYKGSAAVEDYYTSTYGDEQYNRGTVALEFSLPLFKSFSGALVAQNIQAAKSYYAQLSYELTDTICQTMQLVAEAYWSYLNAYSTVQQVEAMQQTVQNRSASMERLIAAGVRSQNDMLGMQVNSIENERTVMSARITCNAARLSLQQLMGVDYELGTPEAAFPALDVTGAALPQAADIDAAFIARIAERRVDMRSLQEQLAAAEAALRRAQTDRRPDAALTFAVGSSGAVYGDSMSGYVSSFARNVQGANLSGGLSFSLSIPNNAHTSAVESAQADYEQARILLTQAHEQLAAQLRNTVYNLNSYHTQVVNAAEALAMQQRLYANEQRRFEAGLITIDDMFNQDSKYLAAQAQYNQIMTAYLTSVLQYRYYTGSLVELTDGDKSKLHKERLYTISAR